MTDLMSTDTTSRASDPSAARRRGLGLALAAAVVSGFSVFINSYGVRAVPDATVYTTAKNLVAAAVLVTLVTLVGLSGRAPARSGAARPARLRPRSIAGLAAVAVIGGSIPFVLFFEGLALANSSHTGFIHKTLIVWVALLAVPLLGERLGVLHVAAIATLVVGQAVLAGGVGALRLGAGELLVLAATLLWSVEVVVAKRLLREIPARTVALTRMGGGVVLLLAWVAVAGHWSGLAAMDMRAWTWAGATGLVLATYVLLWFTALALAPAVDVTAVLVVAAVITGVLNLAVKGTALTPTVGVGLLLVIAGAALAAAPRRPAVEAVGT